MANSVLIVRHGPGRGRIPEYGEHILEWLRAERPDLARSIRLHETGSGPAVLDDVSAVFFWLADPLEIKYPECFRESLAIQEEAERRSVRMLNRPTSLATYGKDVQARRLSADAIPTPPAIRIEGIGDLQDCADRLGFPLLVRGNHTFGQERTRILRNSGDIRSTDPDALPDGAIATALIDARGPRSGTRKGDVWGRDYGLWSRFHHRKRVILIGDHCVADSLFFARNPVVSRETSLYGDFDRKKRWLRQHGRLGKRAVRTLGQSRRLRRAVDLEKEFVESPVAHEDAFRRAGAALELDFLAFDFASLPNGDITIWEANPYPYIPPARKNALDLSRRSAEKVGNIYRTFARCFESLLHG